jgi:hypothetical protein
MGEGHLCTNSDQPDWTVTDATCWEFSTNKFRPLDDSFDLGEVTKIGERPPVSLFVGQDVETRASWPFLIELRLGNRTWRVFPRTLPDLIRLAPALASLAGLVLIQPQRQLASRQAAPGSREDVSRALEEANAPF